MKKIILNCLVIVFLLSLSFVSVHANDNITIYVNEQILQCDVEPYIENGRTMVPMRKIFEALNAKVDWEDTTQTITATKDNTEIVLQINNQTMYNNGVAEALDVAPVIVSSSTFVPIRAVSQSLNASVEWLAYTQSVYINSPVLYENDYAKSLEDSLATETEVTMYAPDGRTISVLSSQVESYKNVGWYIEPVTIMYAADGRTLYVQNSEVEAYKNVGWYIEPVTIMYAADGRTLYVLNSEIAAYQNVGWYLTPVVTMYASDGRTIVVGENEIPNYVNVGWYRTYEEARAANAPSYSAGSSYETGYRTNSNTSYKADSNNRPNSGGSAIYRTPYGERFHYDPDCGGKNSYQITREDAQRAGLTPCKKCAS